MKRLVNILLSCAVLWVSVGTALAQRNPRGAAKLSLGGNEVGVEYGRPSLKGRTAQQLLAGLKPGGFWRLGADTSTTFSTATNLAFNGSVSVPKGKYSLWAQKQTDGGWKLVFNTQTGQWGTEHDAAKDLVATPLSQGKATQAAEMVTINLAEADGGGVLTILWGDLSLSAKFQAK